MRGFYGHSTDILQESILKNEKILPWDDVEDPKFLGESVVDTINSSKNMYIIGEIHYKEMIDKWDKWLAKFKPEYWICEFADMDVCMTDKELQDRLDNAVSENDNIKWTGKQAVYEYNYWVYRLALKHHVKLIGCNPIGRKFTTLEAEFKFREPYMLKTIQKYDKKKCLVQLGDGHLRSIPYTLDFMKFCGEENKDVRGIVQDCRVSFASPIWNYYKDKQNIGIIRVHNEYQRELEYINSIG